MTQAKKLKKLLETEKSIAMTYIVFVPTQYLKLTANYGLLIFVQLVIAIL